uniref:NADH-ubiquinone oxidoreductase chain 4L n=2 Tax=Sinonovacula constricta TaxID=98310 RepID=B5AYF2_SINCO|nr:NADH dehydrogenase subunit 4L [Sinonovacula constricta]ACF41619.1 NADH dehydrogenase subunit 4L [Sinonovacula constricta]
MKMLMFVCLSLFVISMFMLIKDSNHFFMVILSLDVMGMSLIPGCSSLFTGLGFVSKGLAVLVMSLGVCEACLGLAILVSMVRYKGVVSSSSGLACNF